MLNKRNKNIKFVIYSPKQTSGGAIVLHLLCEELIKLGYDARVYVSHKMICKKGLINYFLFWAISFLKGFGDVYKEIKVAILGVDKYLNDKKYDGIAYKPIKNYRRKKLPFVDSKTIVIYPEMVFGNPLKSKKTVRWFLNCNRYSDEAYGNQDLFICYREVFNDKRLNPMNRSLCLHNFNYNLYRQTNYGKRQGKCYIVRKGANRVDLPQYFDGLIVDNLSEIEKVKVFNNCKYCISYDTQTFYSTIASICGCISIVVTEKGKSRKDYCGTGEIIYGVAYGWEEEEINFALKTREKMLEKIVERQRQNLAETQAFVNLCMAFFNNDLNIYEEIVK